MRLIGIHHVAVIGTDHEVSKRFSIDELRGRGVRRKDARMDPHTGKAMAFFVDPDDQPLELSER